MSSHAENDYSDGLKGVAVTVLRMTIVTVLQLNSLV